MEIDRSPVGEIERVLRKLPRFMVQVFALAFVIFLSVHFFAMTNLFMNHDNALVGSGVGGIYSDGGGLSSGRFLLPFVNALSSDYTMPWVIGLVSGVWFSLAVCLMCVIFRIRHLLPAALLALLLAAFPSAASTFSYMYTADAYFFAMLLAALSVWLTERFRFGFAVGALLDMCVLAIYQAYFPFAAALAVFCLLFRVLTVEEKAGAIILRALRHLIALAAGLVLYKLTLDALLELTGTELVNYIGINTMWYLPLWELGGRIMMALRYPFVFFSLPFYAPWVGYVHAAAVLLFVLFVLYRVVVMKLYRCPLRLLLLVGLLAAAPLAAGLMYVMSATVHMVMVYSVALTLAALPAAADNVDIKAAATAGTKRFVRGLCALLLVCALLLGIAGAVVVNKGYLKLNVVFETSYAFCVKLTSRIESTEGWRVGMPVLLAGELSDENRPIQYQQMEELSLLTGIDSERSLLDSRWIPGLCSFFVGDALEKPDAAVKAALLTDERVKEMPIYPYPGSVSVIDGVMVVKLGQIS